MARARKGRSAPASKRRGRPSYEQLGGGEYAEEIGDSGHYRTKFSRPRNYNPIKVGRGKGVVGLSSHQMVIYKGARARGQTHSEAMKYLQQDRFKILRKPKKERIYSVNGVWIGTKVDTKPTFNKNATSSDVNYLPFYIKDKHGKLKMVDEHL